jgi:hypothetical protein
MPEIQSAQVLAFHDSRLAIPAWAKTGAQEHHAGLWQAIEDNHRNNCALWDEEDLARRRNVPDAEIAGNKRAIDRHNQKRNDAIERIDEYLLTSLGEAKEGARLNSETAGSMCDRLSILSLKIHHMRIQTLRTDVEREHIDACKAKLARLVEQRGDLAGCLDRLLADFASGKSFFKVYRQFKMYNDPKLNPAVYNEKK